ncbi:chaperone EMC4, partial [Ascoidea rubescens DSM 1968]
LPSPPGFNEALLVNSNTKSGINSRKSITSSSFNSPIINEAQLDSLKTKKAWDVVTGTVKQVPMNLFMSYMSGNSLQIIPIMTTLMFFTGPVHSILNLKKTFKPFLNNKTFSNYYDILIVEICYVIVNIIIIFIGCYKMNKM